MPKLLSQSQPDEGDGELRVCQMKRIACAKAQRQRHGVFQASNHHNACRVNQLMRVEEQELQKYPEAQAC